MGTPTLVPDPRTVIEMGPRSGMVAVRLAGDLASRLEMSGERLFRTYALACLFISPTT